LHFEFRINGVHHDPLTVARQSESLPVTASAKPMFVKLSAQVRNQLAAAALVQTGTAQ
jgi:hypothetical protein